MKKLNFCLLCLFLGTVFLNAQKIYTREGNVSFYSEAQKENIQAHNSNATSIIDTETGKIEFAILIKAFQFEKALMQQHFNENYMESSKFPKALFKGQIINLSEIHFDKDGIYTAQIKGDITIHGVTKPIETEGVITVAGGEVSGKSDFHLTVADYGIEVPSIVRDNIAREITVDVSCHYQEFKKS